MAELAPEPYKDAVAHAENVKDEIKARRGNDGTALALAQAAEEADREIYRIEQKRSNITGELCIGVYVGYGGLDDGPVPDAVHDLITGWGYEPAEGHGTKNDRPHHNYCKNRN